MKAAVLGVLLSCLGLAGCGVDGSGGFPGGTLRLSVTDAPVDDASGVVVTFSGVQIQPAQGETIDVDFPARNIDLMALTGGRSAVLLPSLVLPAGHYAWLRLKVNIPESYVVVGDDTYGLEIPSGDQSGLKINRGFDVPAGGTADMTVDFDLRRSLHRRGSGASYALRPTLRMVDNTRVGTISGTVDDALLNSPSCTGGYAVYVYAGAGVSPGDLGGPGAQPVTTAPVLPSEGGQHGYRAAFLEAGPYTVAFTCQASNDDPTANDAIDFTGPSTVTVSTDGHTVLDFF
ncbi:MAG: DUF4382 domain-containing protein [Deltaproteobacteria bacterium]|nr:DUF4382 domain-containing protein [Deltaproteobacteria bacterium]